MNLLMATKSSNEVQNKAREKRTDREILLGSGGETKPRSSRNLKEIVAKYRKFKDASSPAASARNKRVQRQEKLEKISNDTEELEGRSEDYASLTNEFFKKMEKRKWWQL
ncbi:PREDICTED: uncharacterized protein LOC105121927 [Populus euphratica]|uniref:Uncharacterized protein LOC105121927 n=1 Tax=Populus euphratica TaxID=75702 RepID=A0AAJ6TWV4_POPEU|nr:PREDICTED: uncharacterized protein LOC105121927 [Populus euphratica]